MSTAELPEPLARRIEQLAAAADDDSRGADLGAVEARDREVQELRKEVTGAFADLRDDVGRTVAELCTSLTTTTEQLGAELRSYAREQAEQAASRLAALDEQARASLAHLHDSVERAEQVSATLARGLTEIADEVDVAATTTRDASERVTVLAEVTEAQRAEVARLRHGVGERLDELDARVGHAAGAVERVAAGLDDVLAATDRLGGTLEGFRTQWPTRTYLEQRDRLLEAERDRVLHDVLDSFAAGLSARERSALAGWVDDVVARRRDARDAERYCGAVGEPDEPVPGPGGELPAAPPTAAEPTAGPAPQARPSDAPS